MSRAFVGFAECMPLRGTDEHEVVGALPGQFAFPKSLEALRRRWGLKCP